MSTVNDSPTNTPSQAPLLKRSTFRDLTGQRVGRLHVLYYVGVRGRGWRSSWLCKCNCGSEVVVAGSDLVRKQPTQSCGCLMIDKTKQTNTKHGKSSTPEHAIWSGMIKRCEYAKDKNFSLYGGRGICVCSRWRESFVSFLEDMGLRPTRTHQLDRYPDTNGDYEPANCRWATPSQNVRNRRCAILIEWRGQTLPLADWAERLGFSHNALYLRHKRGWPLNRMMTEPQRAPR